MSALTRTAAPLDGRWAVDTATTRAAFVARDVLRRPVGGTLTVTSAHVDVVDGVPHEVSARLDLASVATGNVRRDRDLRGPQFFDVDRSRDLVFTGGPARPVPGGWELPGVLVLRGVECPVVLAVELVEAGSGVQARATASLDRRRLGIHVPRLLVGPTVHLAVDAVLRRPEPNRSPRSGT